MVGETFVFKRKPPLSRHSSVSQRIPKELAPLVGVWGRSPRKRRRPQTRPLASSRRFAPPEPYLSVTLPSIKWWERRLSSSANLHFPVTLPSVKGFQRSLLLWWGSGGEAPGKDVVPKRVRSRRQDASPHLSRTSRSLFRPSNGGRDVCLQAQTSTFPSLFRQSKDSKGACSFGGGLGAKPPEKTSSPNASARVSRRS